MSSESLDRYSRQIRFPQLGEAGQRALVEESRGPVRLRRAGNRAGQPPGPGRGRIDSHHRS